MPLSHRSRTALYTNLEPIVGDHAIEELLTCIPATEADEPITKHFLRAEMAELRGELRAEMAELRGEMAELRTELRGEMAELRIEIHKAMHRQTAWLIATMFTFAIVLAAFGHFGPH